MPRTCHLVAVAACGALAACSATRTGVEARDPILVAVSPRSATVALDGTVAFSATVTGTADTRVGWSVLEGAPGGAIGADGVYTAPGTAGTYHVIATSVADATKSDTATLAVRSAPATLAAQLAVLGTKRFWFGHQSTGTNILVGPDEGGTNDGLASLIAQNPGSGLSLVTTTSGSAIAVGVFGNALVGANGDPNGKIDAFDALARGTLRSGTPADLDLAFFKLCWIDFGDGAGASAVRTGADVDALAAHYRNTMDALIQAFPNVKFLHVTAPLRQAGNYYTGLATNALRERYNAALRSHYAASDILDLADWECTGADGRRVYTNPDGTGVFYDDPSGHVRALSADWSLDGGHLNSAGSTHMATRLAEALAAQ